MGENGTRPTGGKIEFSSKINESHLRITLSRLKKRGLLENKNKVWKITKAGIEYVKANGFKVPHFRIKKESRDAVKNMIIIFDIPEINHKKRDWLRVELRNLGFVLLQKSVWFGPAPLPKEFIKYISETNLLKHVKFFKVEEKDLV